MADGANVKKTRGRQKIEMRRIQNEDDRLITFSKRRSGIYKKASELVTLCGAEVAFVVFSPAGKPFSYGHPSVESVINRFINPNLPQEARPQNLESQRRARINALNQQYNEALAQLDLEKNMSKKAEKHLESVDGGQPGWWEVPADELGRPKLHDLIWIMEEKKKFLANKLHQRDNALASAAHGGLMDGTSEAQMVLGDSNFTDGPSGFSPPTALFHGTGNLNAFTGHSLDFAGYGNNLASPSDFPPLRFFLGSGVDQAGPSSLGFGHPGRFHGIGNYDDQAGPSWSGPLDSSHGIHGNDQAGLLGFGPLGPSHGSWSDEVSSSVLSHGLMNDLTGVLSYGLPNYFHNCSGNDQTNLSRLGVPVQDPSQYGSGNDHIGPPYGPSDSFHGLSGFHPGSSHGGGNDQSGPSNT